MLKIKKLLDIEISMKSLFFNSSYKIARRRISQIEKDESAISKPKLLPQARYGGENMVTLLTGKSIIGKQGSSYITKIFSVAKVPVVFERIAVGEGDCLAKEFVLSVRRNRAAIHVDLQHDPEEKRKSMLLASSLDLYACVVDVESIEGFGAVFPDLNITLIFQNNTGNYSKLEYAPVPGVVETLRIVTAESTRKYLDFVYRYAISHGRKKITFAHKVQELPQTDGMFIQVAKELHQEYKDCIDINMITIDDVVRLLVMEPQNFDIICTHDRYGTFCASICGAVCGGIGLFSAVEYGDDHVVIKPLQTKLSITDRRELCPYGIVRACVNLLYYLGHDELAQVLCDELYQAMVCKRVKTREYGGDNSGDYVISYIVNNMKKRLR